MYSVKDATDSPSDVEPFDLKRFAQPGQTTLYIQRDLNYKDQHYCQLFNGILGTKRWRRGICNVAQFYSAAL